MPDTWNPVQEARAQYPGLKDWDDSRILNQLSDPSKFRSAFPKYAHLTDDVIRRNMARLQEQTAMTGTYKPTTVSSGQGRESPVGKFMSGAVHQAAPILATVGGVAGGAIAGPPGAMVGATVGGGVGSVITQKSEAGKVTSGKTYDTAVGQGLLEAGGGMASGVVAAAGRAADRGVYSSMAKILGLRFAKNPRLGMATAEQLEKIAGVVNKYVGGAATLPRLGSKIAAVKESFNQATEHLIGNTPGAKLVPFDQIVTNTAIKAQDVARATGREGYVKPIDELWHTLLGKMPSNSLPKDILELRRTLLKEVDDSGQAIWPAGTKKFRLMLYHDLNQGIGKALPTKEAAEFMANNSRVSKLIMAEDAVKERLAKRVTGQEGRKSMSEIAQGAARAGALPAVGAYEGFRETHSVKGAVAGGLAGYAAYRLAGSTGAASLGIKVKQAIAKAAPALSQGAKNIPEVARIIEAVQSRPQNQP